MNHNLPEVDLFQVLLLKRTIYLKDVMSKRTRRAFPLAEIVLCDVGLTTQLKIFLQYILSLMRTYLRGLVEKVSLA